MEESEVTIESLQSEIARLHSQIHDERNAIQVEYSRYENELRRLNRHVKELEQRNQ